MAFPCQPASQFEFFNSTKLPNRHRRSGGEPSPPINTALPAVAASPPSPPPHFARINSSSARLHHRIPPASNRPDHHRRRPTQALNSSPTLPFGNLNMRIKKLSSLQGVRRFIATSGGHYGVQVSIYHVDGVRSAPDMEVALHAMELDKGWIIPNMDEVRGLANIYRALASASSSLAILAGHWGRRSATRMHAATHLLHAGFELERIPLGIIDATFGRRGVRKLVTAAARSVGERVVELARRLLERNTAKCRGMKVQEAIASLEGEIDGLLVRRVNLPPPPKSQNPKNRRQRSS